MQLPRKKRNSGLSASLLLMGLGAGLMYFLDPNMGNRRRALARDKMVRLRHEADGFIEARSEDLKNRAQGLVAETVSKLQAAPVDDYSLVARVKSNIGRNVVTNPGGINVTANNGVVTLSGHVLGSEIQTLVQHIRSIPGVKHVNNQLQTHEQGTTEPNVQTDVKGASGAKSGQVEQKGPRNP